MIALEMKGLWDLLGQTWGAKFYEQYGPNPNDAWGMFLSNTSLQAAKYALTKLIETGSPFPPTLPEFMVHARKWDRDCSPKYDEQGRPLNGSNVLLPAPDPEKTKANLLRLRELLNS